MSTKIHAQILLTVVLIAFHPGNLVANDQGPRGRNYKISVFDFLH